ncbi:MAG: hypothetical protein HZC38_03355 [Chloroflexi bacterium]|nr:hypothetical protein [Chloroflexota bacterium]MBI5712454.1 hypothetical protein [Chloroflexota bacterium]
MKRIGEHKKHIASLESLWYGDVENSLNVKPILEMISKMHEIKYVHMVCNTKDEFVYNLHLLKHKPNYGILYLAFHGKPGGIILTDGSSITLENLSQLMSTDFSNWIVHFGTCGTINVDEHRLAKFLEMTGASMVSGYTRGDVDWIESAAMDLVFFQQLQHHNDMQMFWRKFKKQYKQFISTTGLQAFAHTSP